MEGFSAVRGSGFRVLADYLVIHNDKGEPRPRRGFSFSATLVGRRVVGCSSNLQAYQCSRRDRRRHVTDS